MRTLIIFMLLFAFILVEAQDAQHVLPENVKKTFNKKFPRAEDVNWELVEGSYKADFFYKEKQSYAEFDTAGNWVQTITKESIKTVYKPVQTYLDEHYKKDKIILIEQAVSADRNDYYYVQIEKKIKGMDEGPIFELFFDKSGRFEELRKPEGFDDQVIPGIDERHVEIPAEVLDAWKKKFVRVEKVDWEKIPHPNDTLGNTFKATFIYRDKPIKAEFLEDGSWFETRTELREAELNTRIQDYIIANHYEDELLIAEKVDRFDKNRHIYLKLQRYQKGQFHPFIFEIWFDYVGKVKDIKRPRELKNQFLVTAELPENIQKMFIGRFRQAQETKWQTNRGEYIAEFIYRDKPTVAVFSDSSWVKTTTVLDVKDRIYAPIDRYIENQYKKYKVEYAEKIVCKKSTENSYYVKLSSKKEVPAEVDLVFDKSGKLKTSKVIRE